MDTIKLDVQAYPVKEPQGSTMAFASVSVLDEFSKAISEDRKQSIGSRLNDGSQKVVQDATQPRAAAMARAHATGAR